MAFNAVWSSDSRLLRCTGPVPSTGASSDPTGGAGVTTGKLGARSSGSEAHAGESERHPLYTYLGDKDTGQTRGASNSSKLTGLLGYEVRE